MLLDLLEKHLVHRQIALVGDTAENCPILEIIVIMRVLTDIEEPVKTEPGWLMNLEIKAN